MCTTFLYGYSQDATESPTSTVKGSWQIELASSNESYLQGEIKTNVNTLFSGLVLFGITDPLELRIGLNFQEELVQVSDIRPTERLNGFTPLQLGIGYDFMKEKGILPQLTAIIDFFIPFTAGMDYRPDFGYAAMRSGFNHTLGQRSNLNYNVGLILGTEEDQSIYLYTIAYYTNLTNNFGFYTELFGDFHSGSSASHFADLGLFYQFHPRFQLETIVGTGLKAEQDVYFNGRLTITIPSRTKNNVN